MKSIKVEWNDDIIYKPLFVFEKELESKLTNNLKIKLNFELFVQLNTIYVYSFRENLYNKIKIYES